MLFFEDLSVDVTEDLFDLIAQHFIDEVSEGAVRRRFIIHEIHETQIDAAVVFQLPERNVSF